MSNIPINSITWLVGFIPTFIFSIRSYRIYHTTKNPVALGYSIFMILIALCLLFFGLPTIFTQNFEILKRTAFMANLFLQVGLLVLLWLAWLLIFRKKINLFFIMTLAILYTGFMLIREYSTLQVYITYPPRLIHYLNIPLVLVMQSIILLVLAVPIGFHFLWQSSAQKDSLSKLRAIMTGLLFIIVPLAATSTNILNKGNDTFTSTLIEFIFFVFLLIALILPKSMTSKISGEITSELNLRN